MPPEGPEVVRRDSTDPFLTGGVVDPLVTNAVAAAPAAALRAATSARCCRFWLWRRCLEGCCLLDMTAD